MLFGSLAGEVLWRTTIIHSITVQETLSLFIPVQAKRAIQIREQNSSHGVGERGDNSDYRETRDQSQEYKDPLHSEETNS